MADSTADLLGHALVQVEQLTRRVEASEELLREERLRNERLLQEVHTRSQHALREQAQQSERSLQEQAARLRAQAEAASQQMCNEMEKLRAGNQALVASTTESMRKELLTLRESIQRQAGQSTAKQARECRLAELQAEEDFAVSRYGKCPSGGAHRWRAIGSKANHTVHHAHGGGVYASDCVKCDGCGEMKQAWKSTRLLPME